MKTTKLLALLAGLLVALHAQATDWGAVPAGEVVPCTFETYGTNGESLTMSGFAATDIEVIKDGSVTVRASDAGYTLMDTDGIDIGTRTGFHGFTIDTGDNTDAGFYTVGGFFNVWVDSVTVNTQTVRLKACTFRLVAAESTAGTPKADVSMEGGAALPANGGNGAFPSRGIVASGTAQAYTAGGPTLQLAASTAMADTDIRAGYLVFAKGSNEDDWVVGTVASYAGATDTVTLVAAFTTAPTGTVLYVIFGTAANADISTILADTNDLQTRVPAALVSGRMDASVGAMAANVMTAAAANADLTTELQTGLNNISTANIRDLVIEDQGGGVSLGCAIAVVLAYASGDLATSGGNSTYEDPSGTETRSTGTVASAGNRTAAITCPTY